MDQLSTTKTMNNMNIFTTPYEGTGRCHQTPSLGEYLPRIAPADVMVIDFGSKNRVVAL
jgi:hypothetical protein